MRYSEMIAREKGRDMQHRYEAQKLAPPRRGTWIFLLLAGICVLAFSI